jgi:hypothetical protein
VLTRVPGLQPDATLWSHNRRHRLRNMMSTRLSGRPDAPPMKRWLSRWLPVWKQPPWWGLAALFLILAVPPALSLRTDNDYVSDERLFHVPAVQQIARNWPSLSVRDDSLSASAPGYHWFLASVSKITGDDVRVLRLVTLTISLAGLMALFEWLLRRVSALDAALLIAPLAASNFYVKSAAWVVIDNPSLILAMLALLHALNTPTRTANAASAGLYGGLATFSRQLHAWVAAPAFCRTLMSGWLAGEQSPGARTKFFAWAAASFVPIVVMAALYATWGGLVPIRWQRLVVDVSTVPFAYILSILALLGGFYYPFHANQIRIRAEPITWISALLLGVILAVSMPTIYNHHLGRWGGYLWELSRILPAPFDRSIVLILLAPIGVLLVIGFYRSIRAAGELDRAVIWLVAIVAWSFMFLANRQIFQRYYEPIILVFLILAVGMSSKATLAAVRRGPLVCLTIIQVSITFATVWWRTFLS